MQLVAKDGRGKAQGQSMLISAEKLYSNLLRGHRDRVGRAKNIDLNKNVQDDSFVSEEVLSD